MGCTLGNSLFPPLSGYLQKNRDAMWVWYLNLICTCGQLLSFLLLDRVFQGMGEAKKNVSSDQKTLLVHYNELPTVSEDEEDEDSDMELDIDAIKMN